MNFVQVKAPTPPPVDDEDLTDDDTGLNKRAR